MEKIIKNCEKHGECQHSIDKNGRIKCSKCASEAVQRRRDKLKIMSVEYKGGKCSMCGYNKCIEALDFHHLDSSEKDFGISAKGYTRSWEIVKQELDKCVLLCANCHRELHSKEKDLVWTINDETQKIESSLTKYYCTKCNKELNDQTKTGLCLDCYKKSLTNSNYPNKEELFELIKIQTFVDIGKTYGVSDNSIRALCKKYNIPSTKKELKELGFI